MRYDIAIIGAGVIGGMAARELSQPVLRDRSPMIVGLAADYAEAMDILYQIIEDAEAAGMRGCLRAFIEKQEGI